MKRKILVVDDEKDIAMALKIRLKNSGYDVLVAFDSVQAYVTAQKEQPDLIILDIVYTRRGWVHRRRAVEEVPHDTTYSDHFSDRDFGSRGKGVSCRRVFLSAETLSSSRLVGGSQKGPGIIFISQSIMRGLLSAIWAVSFPPACPRQTLGF